MTEIQVSVVLPMFNAEATIEYALESVLTQKGVPLEVIVVNDGSTDRSVEIVETFADPRVRILNQPNSGQPAATNAGVLSSNGKYIAFQDADDIWLPGKLQNQFELMENEPGIDVVSCNAFNEDRVNGSEFLVFDHFAELISGMPRLNPADGAFVVDADIRKYLLEGNFIISRATAVLRRHLFDEFGLFDENLRSSDDLDFWLRIGHQATFAFLEEPFFRRVKLETSVSQPTAKWLTEVVKLWEKWNIISQDEQAPDLCCLVERNLAKALRRLIKSQVREGNNAEAWSTWRRTRQLRYDPKTLIFLGLGALGVRKPRF